MITSLPLTLSQKSFSSFFPSFFWGWRQHNTEYNYAVYAQRVVVGNHDEACLRHPQNSVCRTGHYSSGCSVCLDFFPFFFRLFGVVLVASCAISTVFQKKGEDCVDHTMQNIKKKKNLSTFFLYHDRRAAFKYGFFNSYFFLSHYRPGSIGRASKAKSIYRSARRGPREADRTVHPPSSSSSSSPPPPPTPTSFAETSCSIHNECHQLRLSTSLGIIFLPFLCSFYESNLFLLHKL